MISNIENILDAYRKGEMVILIDDENRENEGDLLAPASLITAEHINFMSKYARGLICLTLTASRCDKLRLPLMVTSDKGLGSTSFTLSIEASTGVSTGISAHDRASTVLAAVEPNAKPENIVSPGHIFPLRARDGGVLVRAGHTEAGCDLAKLAGMPVFSSVIVEIMKEDGSMARLPDLERFAKMHNIRLGSIADLIRYRLKSEQLITEVSRQSIEFHGVPFQLVSFDDHVDCLRHYALIHGDLSETKQSEPILVRVHLQNYLSDLLPTSGSNQEKNWQLRDACRYISTHRRGVVILLNPGAVSTSTPEQPKRFDDRTYGKGAQILHALGVQKIQVLGSQSSYRGICGFDLQVKGFVSLETLSEDF